MDGFTYRGKHCTDMHCGYAPDPAALWFQSATYSTNTTMVSGKDGDLYYGNTANPREFSLQCYYEDITFKQRERLREWLDRNKDGDLVFDDRPNVTYHVRPNAVVQGVRYTTRHRGLWMDTYSGTFVIKFVADNPYGKLDRKSYDTHDHAGITNYCDMLETEMMPPPVTLSGGYFYIYNCGTRPADTVIEVGVSQLCSCFVENETNGTKCSLVGVTGNGYWRIESHNGSVRHVAQGGTELDFSCHDDGYIKLAPDRIYGRGYIKTVAGQNYVYADHIEFDGDPTGLFMWDGSTWLAVTGYNAATKKVALSGAMSADDDIKTIFVSMNKLRAVVNGGTFTKLTIDYTPIVE